MSTGDLAVQHVGKMTFFQPLLGKLRPNELLQVEVLSFMPVVSKIGNNPTLESVLKHALLS